MRKHAPRSISSRRDGAVLLTVAALIAFSTSASPKPTSNPLQSSLLDMLPDEIPLSLTDISVEDLVATRRRAVNANTKNKPLGGRICGFRHHCNPRNLSKEEKQRKLKKKPSVLPRILVKKNFDLCNGSLLSYCDLDIIEKLQKGETDEEAFEEFWNNRILKNKKGARRIPSRIVNKEEENINAALDELLPLCDSVQQRLYRMRKKAFIFRDEAFWAGGTLGGEDEARGGGRDRGDVQEEGAEQHGGVIMFDSRRTRRPVGPSIGLSKVVGSSEGAGAVSISFASLGISPDFAGVLQALGFNEPSPIQKLALGPTLEGRDALIQSQSGTGKTSMLAMLCVALSERERAGVTSAQAVPTTSINSYKAEAPASSSPPPSPSSKVVAVVLSPSRELAVQTRNMVNRLGYSLDVHCHALTGGKTVKSDREALSKAKVLSGTPGRTLQLLRTSDESVFAGVKILFVDEVDEIVSEGFNNILLSIKDRLPASVQVVLTSATMTPDVRDMCEKITQDPVKLLTKPEDLAQSGIKQYFVRMSAEDEEERIILCVKLYERLRSLQTIIFANTISTVKTLYRRFKNRGAAVGMMHREVSQKERDSTLADFKAQRLMLLVTTDVWARGIDVQSVMATINFDLPFAPETYLHRVGRAGRFYGKGLAISLVSPKDKSQFAEIQTRYALKIPELPVKFRQNDPAISEKEYHMGQLARENWLRGKRKHR